MPVLIFLTLDFENKPTFSTYFISHATGQETPPFFGLAYWGFLYFCTLTT